MKNTIYALALMFSFDSLLSEESVFGYWLTPGSIVLIENCDDYICGKIETIFVDEGQDPNLILDDQNKDKALRSRTLIGTNILSGFLTKEINQRDFKGGRIYDPRRGRDFKSSLYLKDDGTLKVEGCLAFICDNEEWLPLEVIINDDGTKEATLKNPIEDK